MTDLIKIARSVEACKLHKSKAYIQSESYKAFLHPKCDQCALAVAKAIVEECAKEYENFFAMTEYDPSVKLHIYVGMAIKQVRKLAETEGGK